MFYSHEVLTSRKYGIATVWLVATLGSKSGLKKVSRKAILDVDVVKTCDTIIEPAAPMALRLSGNMLYGVTRVHAQQCGYALTDAEAIKTSMRAVFRALKADALDDANGHKGRAEQLVLEDDPHFLPELDLLPLDLHNVSLEEGLESLRSSVTLTPNHSQKGSAHDQSIGDDMPIVPFSNSSVSGGPVGGGHSLSIHGDDGPGIHVGSGLFQQEEAQGFLEDDLGMQIDADGNFILEEDLPVASVRQSRAPSGRADRTDPPSEAASARVRLEHAEGQQGADFFGQADEDMVILPQDDEYMTGQGEAFPARREPEEQDDVVISESAEAEQRHRHRAPKVIPLDESIEIRGHELKDWDTMYKQNMQEALRHKHAHRLATVAKKNAEHWVLGSGEEQLLQVDRGPLSMFTGIKLLESITGLKLTPGGQKRARDEDPKSDDSRRVRSRGDPSSDEAGRGFAVPDDDGFMPAVEEHSIEQGREQPTPADDRHMSSIFPWNQSTGSRRPTALFSAGGTSATIANIHPPLSRRGSRLPTASPLLGRGLPAGSDDDLNFPTLPPGLGTTIAEDEFELFGPAAQVDTQTAAESQWVRAALDGESANFLEFVKAGIEEIEQDRALGNEEDEELRESIAFDILLPPLENTRVVAAQGLLHVLALVTKNALAAVQEEAFGPIGLRVL